MGDVKWFIGFGFLLGMIFTTHELGLFKRNARIYCKEGCYMAHVS